MSQDTGQVWEGPMPEREILIAMGGNLPSPAGPPRETLQAAAADIERTWGPLRLSRLYSTPAFPAGSGPAYVNAAMGLRSDRPAGELLADLHRIEAAYHRTRSTRWAGRTLDLDLIAVGDEIHPDAQDFARWHGLNPADQQILTPRHLILPHPRLQDRGFVLVPLADVAPGWRHPVLGATVAEMLAALPAEALEGIRPLGG